MDSPEISNEIEGLRYVRRVGKRGTFAARLLGPPAQAGIVHIPGIMQKNERVLLVASARATAARAAQRVAAAGGEAIIITSVAAARAVVGAFNRGIFAFDLPDGSGIVLAAQMMLDARMGEIEFFHPADELVVCDEHPSGVHSTGGTIDSEAIAQKVA